MPQNILDIVSKLWIAKLKKRHEHATCRTTEELRKFTIFWDYIFWSNRVTHHRPHIIVRNTVTKNLPYYWCSHKESKKIKKLLWFESWDGKMFWNAGIGCQDDSSEDWRIVIVPLKLCVSVYHTNLDSSKNRYLRHCAYSKESDIAGTW